jgi:hypothetical protein
MSSYDLLVVVKVLCRLRDSFKVFGTNAFKATREQYIVRAMECCLWIGLDFN